MIKAFFSVAEYFDPLIGFLAFLLQKLWPKKLNFDKIT